MNVSRCETCKIVIIKGLKVIDLKSKKSLKDTYSSCKSTVEDKVLKHSLQVVSGSTS